LLTVLVRCVLLCCWQFLYDVFCCVADSSCTMCYVVLLTVLVRCVLLCCWQFLYDVFCCVADSSCTTCSVVLLIVLVRCVLLCCWQFKSQVNAVHWEEFLTKCQKSIRPNVIIYFLPLFLCCVVLAKIRAAGWLLIWCRLWFNLPSIQLIISPSRRLRCFGYVAQIKGWRGTYRILAENPRWRRPLGGLRRK